MIGGFLKLEEIMEDSKWIRIKKEEKKKNLTKLLLSSVWCCVGFQALVFFLFKQMHTSDAHRAVGASVITCISIIIGSECLSSLLVPWTAFLFSKFVQRWQPLRPAVPSGGLGRDWGGGG